MHVAHVVARIALGVVFVVAGASKVASGPAWPRQAAQLGARPALARAVPWFELIVGALVVVGIARPWPAIVAFAALLLFTGVLVRALRRGQRPPCACFGAWSASPLAWHHVARNAAFATLAMFAILTS